MLAVDAGVLLLFERVASGTGCERAFYLDEFRIDGIAGWSQWGGVTDFYIDANTHTLADWVGGAGLH